MSFSGFGHLDGDRKDGRMLLSHYFGRFLLSGFMARMKLFNRRSLLGFFDDVEESHVEVSV